jgi:hypothetical protein
MLKLSKPTNRQIEVLRPYNDSETMTKWNPNSRVFPPNQASASSRNEVLQRRKQYDSDLRAQRKLVQKRASYETIVTEQEPGQQ